MAWEGGRQPYVLSIDEVILICHTAGWRGEDLVNAVSIAWAESGLDAHAYNPANRNGSIDRGLFQINSGSMGGLTVADVYDPERNVTHAYGMFVSRGFTPWSVWWRDAAAAFSGDAARRAGAGPGDGAYKKHKDVVRAEVMRWSPTGLAGGTAAAPGAGSDIAQAGTMVGLEYGPSYQDTIVKPLPLTTSAGKLAAVTVGLLAGTPGAKRYEQRVVDAPSIELSTNGASQATMRLDDPTWELLTGGMFDIGVPLTFQNLTFMIDAQEVGGGEARQLTVTARAKGIIKLKEKGRVAETVLERVSATEYVRRQAVSAGLRFIGEESPIRDQIGPTSKEDEFGNSGAETPWEVCERLAGELGFWIFEAAGTLYFGRPTWFATRAGARTHKVRYPRTVSASELGLHVIPNMRRVSQESAFASPITGTLTFRHASGSQLRPADRINLLGMPGFEGIYIITNVSIVADGVSDVQVQIETPVNPKPGKPLFDPPSATESALYPSTEGMPAPPNPYGITLPEADQGAGGYRFRWPLNWGRISSRFGYRGWSRSMHKGVDIAVPTGQPVKAAARGKVTRVAWDEGGYGNWIEIEHDDRLRTRYAHLSRTTVEAPHDGTAFGEGDTGFAPGVDPLNPVDHGEMVSRQTAVNQHVEAGQVIGYSGSTGKSTGPHLHFEVRYNGEAVDPFNGELGRWLPPPSSLPTSNPTISQSTPPA